MLALTAGSPPLPGFIVLPALLIYLALILLAVRHVSAPTRFLVIAFAIRMAMSAQPRFSYSSSPVGLSWNALASVVLVLIGCLLLHRSRATVLVLLPLSVLAMSVVASMLLNQNAAGGMESLVKYAYFALIALTVSDAFGRDGPGPVLSRLLFTFALPLALQFASLALGIDKATESDGSASFIGGYNHEASFSIILLTGLLAAVLHPTLKTLPKLAIAAICIAGIFAANYRTAIVSAAPLLVALLLQASISTVPPRQRGVTGILAVLLILLAVPVIPSLVGNRFDTLATLASEPQVLDKGPAEFTQADRDLMSGRLYLWSQYRYAWRQGTQRQHLLGFGANAWEGRYRYYAHNTLVSTLYELGSVGVAGMLLLWLWMLALAVRVPGRLRLTLTAAHLSFFLLNMATMPFWMIEGLLLYGLLCGFTVYSRLVQPPRTRAATATDMRAPQIAGAAIKP